MSLELRPCGLLLRLAATLLQALLACSCTAWP